MDHTDRTPMSADERYDMAAAAAAATRRNRPRHLVILGVLALACGALLLVAAWSSRRAAIAGVEHERRELAEVRQVAGELATLRAARAANPDDEGSFITPPRILSQFEELAAEAGLAKPTVPRTRSINVEGGRRVEWPYTVANPSLQATLDWIRLCMERIPGTFVSGLKIRPAGAQWQVEVVFARYERT